MSFFLFRSTSSSGQTSSIRVTIFSDSIYRNSGPLLEDINSNISWNVYVFPGASVNSLRHHIVNKFGHSTDEVTSYVVLNVGTNNLERSVWNIDKHQYLDLYTSVSERFRAANIIFNAILPRWDSDSLYSQSLHYNHELCKLCKDLRCLFFDASSEFVRDNSFHSLDGLHLNFLGKCKLAEKLVAFITSSFSASTTSIPSCHKIPSELKKLHPKPKKTKLLPWSETDLDIVLYKKREKYGKFVPKKILRTRQLSSPQPSSSSSLNCSNRSTTFTFIPYISLSEKQSLPSTVRLPCPTSLYILNKQKGKRRARRRRRDRKRRRRKRVCF